MKRDIKLEKEVEKTVNNFNSAKRLPSAFHKNSSKQRLDTTDRILIILCILLFLFVFSKVLIKRMPDFVYDKLNETDSLTYIQKSSYGDYYPLIKGSTILYKDIQIEKEGEDG